MSQVMDGLVHQWQAGLAQSLPLHTQLKAPPASPCALHHSAMQHLAGMQPALQACQHNPTATAHPCQPGVASVHMQHGNIPACNTGHDAMHAAPAGSGSWPPQADVVAAGNMAPRAPAVRRCDSPSEVVVADMAPWPGTTADRMQSCSSVKMEVVPPAPRMECSGVLAAAGTQCCRVTPDATVHGDGAAHYGRGYEPVEARGSKPSGCLGKLDFPAEAASIGEAEVPAVEDAGCDSVEQGRQLSGDAVSTDVAVKIVGHLTGKSVLLRTEGDLCVDGHTTSGEGMGRAALPEAGDRDGNSVNSRVPSQDRFHAENASAVWSDSIRDDTVQVCKVHLHTVHINTEVQFAVH